MKASTATEVVRTKNPFLYKLNGQRRIKEIDCVLIERGEVKDV